MQITTDFECGAGKKLARVSDHHWRVEANGDASGYNKYFCLRISAAGETARVPLHLEIHPDSELGEAGAAFFISHFPSNLWFSVVGSGYWCAVRNRWEGAVTYQDRHIEVNLTLDPGVEILLATNPPLPYSELLQWIETTRVRHAGRLELTSLGASAEGRDIPVLRIPGARAGLPKLLVLAGQHPSEHCGNWACQGIVEYALSAVAGAREIADAFELAVVPMVNPDGNVHGLSGANAEGVNLFNDFAGPAGAPTPRSTENRRLWEWIGAHFTPEALLHFHGYMGWRAFSQHPYDGSYVLKAAVSLYAAPGRPDAYRAIQDHLKFETPAYSASGRANLLDEATLEHHLAARYGTLCAFYEINSASVGAIEQFRRGPQVLGAVVRALAG